MKKIRIIEILETKKLSELDNFSSKDEDIKKEKNKSVKFLLRLCIETSKFFCIN